MRSRTLFLFQLTASCRLRLPLPSSTNVGSSSKPSTSPSTSPSASKSTWAPTTSSPPPPEFVDPFHDLTDVIITSSPHHFFDLSPWVPPILNLLKDTTEMEHDLNTFCRKFLIKLSPNFVTHVLQSDNLKTQPETALRFFQWAAKQHKYTHNLESYVSLIHVLCSCNDLDSVRHVFNELRETRLLMNANAANGLVRSFGSVGMVEELLWVWRAMKENEIEPSLFTFNFLVNGLVESMFVDSAEKVFDVMMEGGKVAPDVVTYNMMIKGYCKAGRVKKAMERFFIRRGGTWRQIRLRI